MTEHREIGSGDGRVGWPTIVTYRTKDGVDHVCYPRDGRGFTVEIHDQDAYQKLVAAGLLYSEKHCGKREPAVDNRSSKV